MQGSLTQRAYLKWQKYWEFEPWGPWRENLHAAILAREIRRPQQSAGSQIELDQFMVRDPRERNKTAAMGFWNFMKSMAKRKPKAERPEHDGPR